MIKRIKPLPTTFEKLPDELRQAMFKVHSHTEIEMANNPDQIVYKEKDVIALLGIAYKLKRRGVKKTKTHGKGKNMSSL